MAGTCVCDLSERTEKDRGALVGTSAQSAPLQVRYSATDCYAVEAERVRTGPRRQAHVAGKGGIENPAMVRSTYREQAESDRITNAAPVPFGPDIALRQVLAS